MIRRFETELRPWKKSLSGLRSATTGLENVAKIDPDELVGLFRANSSRPVTISAAFAQTEPLLAPLMSVALRTYLCAPYFSRAARVTATPSE